MSWVEQGTKDLTPLLIKHADGFHFASKGTMPE